MTTPTEVRPIAHDQTQPTELDSACYRFQQAKAAEDQARNERLSAEKEVLRLVGFKEEGTTSAKTAWYKVKTVGKLNRSIVANRLSEVQSLVPTAIFEQVIRYKPELSLSGLRAVEKANPGIYQVLVRAIVTKPAKASVSVELIEQQRAA